MPIGGGCVETWKRAQNLQIISLKEGAAVGRLDDFQFDLESWKIYGWRLKGLGVFARAGGVTPDRLKLIGRDVAFVESEQDIEWSGGRPNQARDRAWASAYNGMSVMSRRGSMMGAVQDFVIDVAGDAVTGLILHGNRLLVLNEDVQTGPDVIIARTSDVVVALPEGEQKASWWRRMLRSRRPAELGSAAELGGIEE